MKYIFLTLNLLLVSCADNNKTSDVKTVNLGNFSFMVPINSKIETLKSIDTQAGKITFDSTVVYFDYGYSAISPNAVKTELEFIQKGRWLPDAVVQIMPKNHTYSSDTIREKVKIINIDYKNYTAILSYNSYNFFYKIQA